MLQLDDSALQTNDCRVRAVIGVQLRKNALDATLDSVFGDGELIRDLLVRIASGDEPQHDHFSRREGLSPTCSAIWNDTSDDRPRRPACTARIV